MSLAINTARAPNDLHWLEARGDRAVKHIDDQDAQHEALLGWAMKARSRAVLIANTYRFLGGRGRVAIAATDRRRVAFDELLVVADAAIKWAYRAYDAQASATCCFYMPDQWAMP